MGDRKMRKGENKEQMRQNANSKTIDLNLIINNHIKYK